MRSERRAVVYEVATEPGVWRTRIELYPEHVRAGSGWFGGRVLWSHDQPSKELADALAARWVHLGETPVSLLAG